MGYVITFDLDGVFTDIWTDCEARIHNAKLGDMTAFANTMTEYQELVELARTFSWADVTDFELSSLTPIQRAFVFSHWDNKAFRHPLPMYNGNFVSKTYKWSEAELIPEADKDRIPFKDYAYWLNMLAQRPDVDSVRIHTHCPENLVAARKSWFNAEFRDYAPSVQLHLDSGETKSKLVGDIVIEDSLSNLLNADAKVKILRSVFHNSAKSDRNKALVGTKADTFICVANAKTMRQVVDTALACHCDFDQVRDVFF